MDNESKIIVIGGGPSGIMAAITASRTASEVILLEKTSSLGNKLLLTGNGRCNLTNACDLDGFLSKFSQNGAFLRNAFKEMSNTDLIDFFKYRGLKCKTENEKVFPATENAKDILAVLKTALHKNNVTVFYNSPVKKISSRKNHVHSVKIADGRVLNAGGVILATGGCSYPSTGSTGDGYKIAKNLEHTIIPTRPGLAPIPVREDFPGKLMGLSLQNIKLKILFEKRKVVSQKGDIVFTQKGFSGPLALSVSGFISDLLSTGQKVHVSIDQFPETPKDSFKIVLRSYFNMHPSKTIKNCLSNFIPQRMCNLFLDISDIEKQKKSNQITQKEIAALAKLSKEFQLSVCNALSINNAMITRGGISLKEIDPRSMGSRIVKGLYFAGEIIDLDGDTGGFNLQEAFSTGYLAGKSAAS